MRNLTELMDRMLTEIPKGLIKNRIKFEFSKVKDSISFTAPEAMIERWNEVSSILQFYLNDPDNEWKLKVQNIFNDQED